MSSDFTTSCLIASGTIPAGSGATVLAGSKFGGASYEFQIHALEIYITTAAAGTVDIQLVGSAVDAFNKTLANGGSAATVVAKQTVGTGNAAGSTFSVLVADSLVDNLAASKFGINLSATDANLVANYRVWGTPSYC